MVGPYKIAMCLRVLLPKYVMGTGSFSFTLENCFISHMLDCKLLSMDKHVEKQYVNTLND